jgi:glycosyltransferase involved in cell wall biosynthesis
MIKKLDELSVFFPAYNEEKNIAPTVKKAAKIAPKVAKKWEIVIINDGSSDKTLEVAKKLEKEIKGVRVEDHKKNRGYGAAFKTGLYKTKYEWICFTDADGQFDFSEITNFIKEQREKEADIVAGYYKKRQVSKGKILTSKMWEYLVFFLFGLKVKDIDCGFKLISRKVVDGISKLESERGAFISSEFLIKAKKKGFKIVEIPVTHYPRTEGVGTGRNIGVIINSFKDLFRLWRKLR